MTTTTSRRPTPSVSTEKEATVAATKLNLSWLAGDTETHEFYYKDSEGSTIVVDSATMDLRADITDEVAAISKEAVIAADGKVTFEFTPAETATLVTLPDLDKLYLFDTQVVRLDGTSKTITRGTITVALTVTR